MNASLQFDDNHTARISGELNFKTVPKLRKLGTDLLAKHPKVKFSFAEISLSDSAAVALLIAWFRYAKQHQKEIIFTDLPHQLIEVINLCRLNQLLPIG